MMSMQFDVRQDFSIKKKLNAVTQQQRGQGLYLIAQAGRFYVLKCVERAADVYIKDLHARELYNYQRFKSAAFCADFSIITAEALRSSYLASHLDADCLLLPYFQTFEQLFLLPIATKLNYFFGICQQFQLLHAMGYLHTDIKLQHCAVKENTFKVLDLAQIIRHDTAQGVAELAATPAYMAPELFRGSQFSYQTDIYALGIVFYSLLNGVKPFKAQSYTEWARQHCQYDIPLLIPELRHYQDCLDRMLAKFAHNRFDTIAQLLIALNLRAVNDLTI